MQQTYVEALAVLQDKLAAETGANKVCCGFFSFRSRRFLVGAKGSSTPKPCPPGLAPAHECVASHDSLCETSLHSQRRAACASERHDGSS